MNVFHLNSNPEKAARLMHNKHVVKMILESAQMLCTAYHIKSDCRNDVPYKKAYENHPMTIWVRESTGNLEWLIRHSLELCSIYKKWRDREHASEKVIKWCFDNKSKLTGLKNVSKKMTPPPLCMPDKYKIKYRSGLNNYVASYLNYYRNEKIQVNSEWCNRVRPAFTLLLIKSCYITKY